MIPRAVSEHYRAQQRLIVAALGLTRREWVGMGADFDESWRTVGPRLVLLTGSAQLGAARSGARYVPDALEQQRIRVNADAEVDPRAFAGIASDGRPLDSLLYGAVIDAKEQVAQGAAPAEALAVGGRTLDMYVHTMIADAARGSAGVAIAARPKVGWVRMVNPPCCSRCAVLAGKVFKWNHGFARHPRCDCTHIPAAEDSPGNLGTDPDMLFSPGQVKGLTEAERRAIADGADPAQVINARRGQAADRLTTSEGTTRRGLASQRIRESRQARETVANVGPRGAVSNYRERRVVRPTPEAIYRYAASREDALALLQRNGYLV